MVYYIQKCIYKFQLDVRVANFFVNAVKCAYPLNTFVMASLNVHSVKMKWIAVSENIYYYFVINYYP